MSILFSHFLSKNKEIRPQEADFTEVLTTIAVMPKMLYFYGKMPENRVFAGSAGMARAKARLTTEVLERPKTVAIVGTRKPTEYGAMVAKKLAYDLARRGAVIVSGLAYGIDSIAHRGALEAGGTTVAALGTPIDQIYPERHVGLAEEIVKTGGCVMSEVPAGTGVGDEYVPGKVYQPKTCFLERNRIISGLSDAVIVVEAAERSGSLNTAAHALEQGREVFAVPGDITRPMSRGCNQLIKQGATPLLEVEDVANLLFPAPKKKKRQQMQLLIGDTDEETVILRAISSGLSKGEEILQKTGLDAAKFSQNLTMLEIKGRVMALGMNKWALK